MTLGSVLGALVALIFVFALIPGEPVPWLILAGLGVLALVARWVFYRQN